MLEIVCCESDSCFSLSLECKKEGGCATLNQKWSNYEHSDLKGFSISAHRELGEVKLGRGMNLPSVKVIYLQASKRKVTVEFF